MDNLVDMNKVAKYPFIEPNLSIKAAPDKDQVDVPAVEGPAIDLARSIDVVTNEDLIVDEGFPKDPIEE